MGCDGSVAVVQTACTGEVGTEECCITQPVPEEAPFYLFQSELSIDDPDIFMAQQSGLFVEYGFTGPTATFDQGPAVDPPPFPNVSPGNDLIPPPDPPPPPPPTPTVSGGPTFTVIVLAEQ